MSYPSGLYQYRSDEPPAGPHRPLSQGDVFDGVPLVSAAVPNPKQAGTWKTPKPRLGLGMFVTHPCASRNQVTFKLAPFVAVAPVVKCPKEWGPPWDGYYYLIPLPGLRNGEDYVARLDQVCSVASEALPGHRVACLNQAGLEALFHRLAMNSLRFPETPAHYRTEAARLTYEVDLWELWTKQSGSEDGFQEWLNGPFQGQQSEDPEGKLIAGSAQPTGGTRREVLVWNYDEIRNELEAHLNR